MYSATAINDVSTNHSAHLPAKNVLWWLRSSLLTNLCDNAFGNIFFKLIVYDLVVETFNFRFSIMSRAIMESSPISLAAISPALPCRYTPSNADSAGE